MLYQRLISLISTSYLSLLAQFCHVVTATQVTLCVYNSVTHTHTHTHVRFCEKDNDNSAF